jgi:catalase
MLTRVYSDYGTPAGYRFMDGNGVHAYKFVNAAGEITYVKFHWKSLQGQKNLTASEASAVQAKDFNHASRDLIDAIDHSDFPRWDLYIQTLKPQELGRFDFNALDATKIWPGVAEMKIGTLTLNRNPANVFEETEQSAFAPSNLVPGIEPSEDRLLQGRVFAYADTQLYRVGTNGLQLPINRPLVHVVNGNQDGAMNGASTSTDVNYQPSDRRPAVDVASYKYSQLPLAGTTQQAAITKTLNFRQAGEFYRSLSPVEQKNLVANLAADLKAVKAQQTRMTMLSYFQKADADYGRAISIAVGANPQQVAVLASQLSE